MSAFSCANTLCLREFSKSLTDRASTWYANLRPGSSMTLNTSWPSLMQSSSILRSNSLSLNSSAYPSTQVKTWTLMWRFHDKAFDCCDPIEEKMFINVYFYVMIEDYRIFLKNLPPILLQVDGSCLPYQCISEIRLSEPASSALHLGRGPLPPLLSKERDLDRSDHANQLKKSRSQGS